MFGLGILLLLAGFGLLIWGGAELAQETGAGLPSNPIEMVILIIFSVFRTKSGLIGVGCLLVGVFFLYLSGA